MSFRKVPLYSANGLRKEADEHLHEAFESLGYKESFVQTDIKLFFGYVSVALAGLMYWAEKKYGNDFNNLKYVSLTKTLVIGYFVIQGGLYLYQRFLVENTKYIGYKKGKKIVASTWTDNEGAENSEPLYCIEIEIDGYECGVQKKVSELFFDDGFLNMEALKTTINQCIEAVDKSK